MLHYDGRINYRAKGLKFELRNPVKDMVQNLSITGSTTNMICLFVYLYSLIKKYIARSESTSDGRGSDEYAF